MYCVKFSHIATMLLGMGHRVWSETTYAYRNNFIISLSLFSSLHSSSEVWETIFRTCLWGRGGEGGSFGREYVQCRWAAFADSLGS